MKRTTFMCLAALLSMASHTALAQQATEVYIPIGESPGVSDGKSIVGPISSVDHDGYRMTVSVAGRSRSIAMTPTTHYYLDRTGKRRQNRTATIDDCEAGLRVEVYLDETGNAIWVKIEAAE